MKTLLFLKLFVQIKFKDETIWWNTYMSLTFNKIEDLSVIKTRNMAWTETIDLAKEK